MPLEPVACMIKGMTVRAGGLQSSQGGLLVMAPGPQVDLATLALSGV